MSFEIGKKISLDGINLDDLLKDINGEKEKQKIISVFERFNTNKTPENGKQVLDKKEQVELFNFLKKLAGEDNKITRSEARNDKENKFSDFRDFTEALGLVISNSNNTVAVDKIKFHNNGNYSIEENGCLTTYNDKREIIDKKDKIGRKLFENGAFDKKFSYYYANETDVNEKPNKVDIEKDGNTTTYYLKDDGYYYADNSDGKKYKLENCPMLQGNPIDMIPVANNFRHAAIINEEEVQIPENTSITHETIEEDTRPLRSTQRRKINLPTHWKNRQADVPEEVKKLKTANEVLEKLLPVGIELTDAQKDALTADLIKYNPSIFSTDGQVYRDAIWTKLDFPTEQSLKRKYAGVSANNENVHDEITSDKETTAGNQETVRRGVVTAGNLTFDGVDTQPRFRKTACNGIVYDQNSGQHYRQQGDRFTLIKPTVPGYTISEFKSDGSHIEKFNTRNKRVSVLVNKNGRIMYSDVYETEAGIEYKQEHNTYYNNGKLKKTHLFLGDVEHHFAPNGKTETAIFDTRHKELTLYPYLVGNKAVVFIDGRQFEVPNAKNITKETLSKAFAIRLKQAGIQFKTISINSWS